MTEEFNKWWNEDLLSQDNPYVDGTAAFWAWEGWQAALAQLEQEPAAKVNDEGFIVETGLLLSPGTLLYTSPPAAHPAPVREPLSELEKDAANLLFALHDAWPYVHGHCTIESTKKAIQALIFKHGEFADLHPTAAQRTWVGLTDAERNKLWRDVVKWGDPSHDDVDLMRALEAKLKEKNA